jgi:hypothetical protein
VGDGGTCVITTGMPACDVCINEKCLDECNACAGNADCKAAFDCVNASCRGDGGAVDMECALGCISNHPNGLNLLVAFWKGQTPGCVSSNCATECPDGVQQ